MVLKMFCRMRKKKFGATFRKRFLELEGPVLNYYEDGVYYNSPSATDENIPRGNIHLVKNLVSIRKQGPKGFEIVNHNGDTYIDFINASKERHST